MTIRDVTTATFDSILQECIQKDRLLLVDFWADWCFPCKAMGPVLKAISQEYPVELEVAKINVDENRDLAVDFEVRSIPAMILFKNGKPVDQLVGAVPKAKLEEMIKRHL